VVLGLGEQEAKMATTDWLWQVIPLGLLVGLSVIYGRGWRRARHWGLPLAGYGRWVAWGLGLLFLLAAQGTPLYALSNQLLLARSLQKIFVCMLAPPLLWLAVPVHFCLLGLPVGWRRQLVQRFWRNQGFRRRLCSLTNPGATWLGFVAAFLLWHDAGFAEAIARHAVLHHVALWVLFATALLYWWHVVKTGPRLHPRLAGWVLFFYLIGVEIPNMAAGITIAFTGHPVYTFYALAHAAPGYPFTLSVMNDQIIAGGLIWVLGSLVYFFSAIMVLRQLFVQTKHDSPLHFPDWDSEEKMIAPGLEHRIKKSIMNGER
jgi:putative membrane protein